MRGWALILGGLVVWTAHFFALYAIGSLFPGQARAYWLSVAAALPAVLANGWILWLALRRLPRSDPFDRWTCRIGAAGAGLSLVAVLWQSLPGLLL